MDGYRNSAHLDNIHRPGRAGGNRVRHDHHGLQGRAVEDLFVAPHAEHQLHEGELGHTHTHTHIECEAK